MAYEVKVGDDGDRAPLDALMTDLSNNAVEEASDVHFAEPKLDTFSQFFASNSRTDAIVMMAYLKVRPDDELVTKTARGLMEARVKGRWKNTQENAYALLSLSRYTDVYERDVPDFVARMWLGKDFALEETFEGRSTRLAEHEVPMTSLLKRGESEIVLAKEGDGRLYYRLGLTYAPKKRDLPAREHGFTLLRSYKEIDGTATGPDSAGSTTVGAGKYVQVKLTYVVPVERHWVVLDVPIPAGVEPVNMKFKTSLAALSEHTKTKQEGYWGGYWQTSFDHTEMRDERVLLFADRLAPGVYEHTFLVRATSLGKFYVPPAKISEMYQPEVFGRTSSESFVVR
jgi:uncharacterized protein YfaS (alpha-2-macroglobulin family)